MAYQDPNQLSLPLESDLFADVSVLATNQSVSSTSSTKRDTNTQAVQGTPVVQSSLFDISENKDSSPPPAKGNGVPKNNKASKRTASKTGSNGNKSRLTKKEKAKKDFMGAFLKNDNQAMSEIVKEHQEQWMPVGWSPLQLAAYEKNINQLKFFLNLGFKPRTKKRQGGNSFEHNPLHIAIKMDFKEGAQTILKYIGYMPMHSRIRRFVDEKDNNKQTPWVLAIQADMRTRTLRFINIVGRFHPSGYVLSFVKGRSEPVDGYEYARKTGEPKVIQAANNYLIASNYNTYKEHREEYGHRIKLPTH